jgi:hypothetical protein
MKYWHVIAMYQVVQKPKSSHMPAWFLQQEFKSATHFVLFCFGYQEATSQPLLDKTTNWIRLGTLRAH